MQTQQRDPFTEDDPAPSFHGVDDHDMEFLLNGVGKEQQGCPGCADDTVPGTYVEQGVSGERPWVSFSCGHVVVRDQDVP